uniref:uncharacterized protein n=1 Tax=Pristiophorus japonicus TaxID=55135 RepID=UPI00398EF6E0
MEQHPPRIKNFLHEEVEILVNVIEQRWQELDTSNRGHIKVPPKEMRKRWNQVAEDYCTVVHTRRSGSQCKKKWHDLGQVVNKKLSHNKREATQTEGSMPNLHPLTPLEQRVAAMMSHTWRKAISTAQAGPTREEEEHADDDDDAANPEDPEDTEQEPVQPDHQVIAEKVAGVVVVDAGMFSDIGVGADLGGILKAKLNSKIYDLGSGEVELVCKRSCSAAQSEELRHKTQCLLNGRHYDSITLGLSAGKAVLTQLLMNTIHIKLCGMLDH